MIQDYLPVPKVNTHPVKLHSRLWNSAGLKMPIHAHFSVVLGILTNKVGQTELVWCAITAH